MGQMRFVIPRPQRVIPGAAEQAYLASGDGIPWECHVTLVDEALVIERDTRESGYLYFPWKVGDRGLVQLCSGSLMERSKPYVLPIELARGTLNRLRNQAGIWQAAGMIIPTGFFDALHTATAVFAKAATSQNHPQAAQDQAEEAIGVALEAADTLCLEYAQQVLAI